MSVLINWAFLLLYADNTILIAESAEEMQLMLNKFGEYCAKWNFSVNMNKTT